MLRRRTALSSLIYRAPNLFFDSPFFESSFDFSFLRAVQNQMREVSGQKASGDQKVLGVSLHFLIGNRNSLFTASRKFSDVHSSQAINPSLFQ